ncbi:hypothetical protein D9757_011611 [Collybiopsis confluens]|uniref:Uncharacterized protein n=1 Tax=Collybiopsis confluens TaxID=2823264 RepID=A0A8H5GWU0_9AGAR|nr:hypothetical protein D9757_011611 [Collybiopsis confluens]
MGYTYTRYVFGITLSDAYLEQRPESDETSAINGAFDDAQKVWKRIQLVYVETRNGCVPCLAFAANDPRGTYIGRPRPPDDIMNRVLFSMKLEKTFGWYRAVE